MKKGKKKKKEKKKKETQISPPFSFAGKEFAYSG
jgi:hypothetical protein